jgi:hypothetical protein
VLIVFMIVGLNLHKAFPEMSAVAGGIPALTIIVLILQWSFNPLLLAQKLREIEIASGTTIGLMNDADVSKTRARKRNARRK